PSKPAPAKRTAKPKAKPSQETQPSASQAPAESAQNNPAPAAASAPPPPQPITVTVPANTILTVRTIDSIDSATNHTGEVFRGSLDAPIVVNDRVVVPAGANAFIKLANASSQGRFAGRNELTLELASITYQGRTYNLTTSDVKQSGGS